jgi:hypothetical protein
LKIVRTFTRTVTPHLGGAITNAENRMMQTFEPPT